MIEAYRVEIELGRIEPLVFTFLEQGTARGVVRRANSRGSVATLSEIRINTLSSQRVQLLGMVLGCRFAQTRPGRRTVRRTVRELRRDVVGHIYGTVTYKDWTVTVRRKHFDTWESIGATAN